MAKHDRQGVVQRINFLTAIVRKQSGKVIWVRHCGKAGDGFERYTEGWSLLPELSPHRDDVVIEKTLNDPFVRTSLQETLERYENGTRGILHFFKSSLTSDENDYVPTSRVSCIHVLLRRMTPAPQSARLVVVMRTERFVMRSLHTKW
jgi:Isochorismatase family